MNFTSRLSLSRVATIVAAITSALTLTAHAQNPPPAFSQIIVFGDSLSDDGNLRNRTNDASGGQISYPSGTYNYSDGRFTNSTDTDPASRLYTGTWHEQLARTFLSLPEARNSLNGGTDYAFGGATTKDGSTQRTVINNPSPFGGGDLTITIDNMGKQVSDYVAARVVDPNALYVVWGGGNDLFDDPSSTSVSATATRVGMLVSRLATAGAKYIMVPNVPPLGTIPKYNTNASVSTTYDNASLEYRTQLNANLDSTLATLATQGFTPTVYRLDVWANTVGIFADPGKYGFINVHTAIQGKSGFNADQFLFWDDIHPTTSGHYQTAVGAYKAITQPPYAPAKAVNLSTRADVGIDQNVSIVGFIVTGNVPKKVVVRGLGPSLATRGVTGYLADPTLALYDSSNALVATNDNWKDTQAAEVTASGVPPQNDLESAIVKTLAPGGYTAVLAGKNSGTGVGLVEVYDNDNAASTLANLSTRGYVGTGENVMIGGFIVAAGDPPLTLVRAIGPSLSSAGVTAPLLDPVLELHDANGAVLRQNNNWKDNPAEAQATRGTTLQPTDDREAAIAAFLQPGNYTAVVRGANDTTGIALVEAYRIP